MRSFIAGHSLYNCGVLAPEHVGSLVEAYLLQGMWDLSSLTRDRTHVPCTARWILNHWTTRKVLECDLFLEVGSLQMYIVKRRSYWAPKSLQMVTAAMKLKDA